MIRAVTVLIDVVVRRSRTSKLWIGECPALDIVSQGRSEVEATEAIRDAVERYMRWNGPVKRWRAAARKQA